VSYTKLDREEYRINGDKSIIATKIWWLGGWSKLSTINQRVGKNFKKREKAEVSEIYEFGVKKKKLPGFTTK